MSGNRLFNQVRLRRPGSNVFDLSHEVKMSMKMGMLTPHYLQEIIPGDRFSVNSETMLRFAPLLAPIMHRVDVYQHFFFVPNRIIWNNWEDFITGGEDGNAAPVFPKLVLGQSNNNAPVKGSLADYLGVPTKRPSESVNANNGISALPFRAYQTIYNEYYRDQNLQDKVDFGLGDEADDDVDQLTTLRRRAWEKDYFTSALPDAQKGGDVGVPVDIKYKDASDIFRTDGTGGGLTDAALTRSNNNKVQQATAGDPVDSRIENLDDEAMNVNITELRRAARLQEWLEKNARAGSRYTESILAHFGVMSKDQRLQRPEYLGGGRTPVTISEVLSTATTEIEGAILTPTGNMAGHGISIGKSNRFKRRFTEHGFILGIISVLPRTAYQDGLERHWFKDDKFMYYWPEFAHIGEQEIQNREVYLHWQTSGISMGGTFGYAPRYAEYKFKNSRVAGDFRESLDFWHMGRKFDTNPVLNEDFIKSDPTKRNFAIVDDTEDELYVQIYNSVRARRPMPVFGDPKL